VSHNSYLLDTSAVITFFDNKPGAERVEEVLINENVLLPWPVLFEVYYIIHREKGQDEADNLLPSLKDLTTSIIWDVHEPFVLNAARIKAQYRLSVADALIIAYAFQNDAILLHKDPEFTPLSGIMLQESLPFK
jgi:predicted nucleic acid-binding protein